MPAIRIPGSRAVAALALGALVLAGCGGDSVESFADAEENYLVGCLEPIDGQPAQFEDGKVVEAERHPNYDECLEMWEAIQDELTFEDFKLAADAIDEEPDLLDPDFEVPTGLVSEEDQARLEDTVEILKGIARDIQLSGAA